VKDNNKRRVVNILLLFIYLLIIIVYVYSSIPPSLRLVSFQLLSILTINKIRARLKEEASFCVFYPLFSPGYGLQQKE